MPDAVAMRGSKVGLVRVVVNEQGQDSEELSEGGRAGRALPISASITPRLGISSGCWGGLGRGDPAAAGRCGGLKWLVPKQLGWVCMAWFW